MTKRSKPPALCDCSRSYLEHIIAELEVRKAAGQQYNEAALEEARILVRTAPDYFIEHGY